MKRVRLTKFTGTVHKNSQGQLVIKGRGGARKVSSGKKAKRRKK